MKNTQTTTILMGLTAFCAVLALVMCGFVLQFTRIIRDFQAVQAQAAEVQNLQIARQMLVTELNEYGKRNPDIMRILQPNSVPAAGKPTAR